MALGLEGLAGGLENLQKINKQLQQSHDQQRMLQLELLRSAPPGYIPDQTQGAFGPEYGLKYVGAQDPRIQLQIQQAAESQRREIAGRIALEKALNPILAERGAAERQLLEDSQLRQAKALEGMRAEAEFAGQVQGTDFAAVAGMVPEARQATLAKALQAFGQLQSVAPERAQRAVQALPPDAQTYFGGGQPRPGGQAAAPPGGQVPAGPANVSGPQPAPQNENQAPSPDREFRPGPEVGAAYPVRKAGQPAAPVQTPAASQAASAAAAAGPLTEENLSAYVVAQQEAGVPDEQIRNQALAKLRQSYGDTRPPGYFVGLVDKAILTREETAQRERNIRRARAEDVGLTSEQARFEQPVFENELAVPQGAHTDDDPYYAGKAPAVDKSGKPIEGAEPVDKVLVNTRAIPQTGVGDAVPLAKVRSQIQNQGIEPAVAAELAARPWGAASQQNLRALDARAVKDGVMVVRPRALAVGPEAFPLLQTGEAGGAPIMARPEGIATPEEFMVAERDPRTGALTGARAGPITPEAPEGLTPQGLAENIWMAALSNRPSAPFVFVLGQVPPELKAVTQARNRAAIARMAERGIKPPRYEAGFWIDVEQLVGPLPKQEAR